MDKYEIAMKILEDERAKELDCAMHTRELMRKTLNPIRRIKLKFQGQTFMNHSIGVQIATLRIQRELKES